MIYNLFKHPTAEKLSAIVKRADLACGNGALRLIKTEFKLAIVTLR